VRVYVNGECREFVDDVSLSELIRELDLPVSRVAIELNRVVVRRSNWKTTLVHDGDRLEIVHFVGGGSRN
jgi:thiamine biosynthesis protein ThiS